ncbi:hypothetical protein CEY16_09235 [Halalkalibacillus sediminis]|uniref:HD-GYP domain-containing protein n=1 Tax=Halalkalibacillus sediminis TaxID=2018042 RepID=A0A2I0QVG3_9BACI|nr:HD-GYP domain-containing protein [Halalkalibacillus sediminis]PKR78090.1 hypothetical protein CEY16_09235 [Halalkalibacillus sediminis]
MRAVQITNVWPGDRLGRPITDSYGRVLLQKGVIFTEKLIRKLEELHFSFVFIDDETTDGIIPQSGISESLRLEAIDNVRSAFRSIDGYVQGHMNQYILERTVESIHRTVVDLTQAIKDNDQIISIISDIFVYDNYLYVHSVNVGLYTIALANKLGFSDRQIEEIGIGALLHDIGKMRVPQSILNKPDKLSDMEYEVVKEHTTYGYNLLKDVPNLPPNISFCAYQHHERLNGSGYPLGIEGSNIHEYAKIIAVADVFDAVTSNRVYRKGMLPHEGLEILYSGSNGLFKKEYVDLFRKTISIYPNGAYVELNDGRRGIVADQSKSIPDRPIIRILEDKDMKLNMHEIYEIDLSVSPSVMISKCNTNPI